MINCSKSEKLKYIKDVGIEFIENSNMDVEELYNLAITKDLIKQRLKDGQVDCFGFIDAASPICKKCFMSKNGLCKKYQDYRIHVHELKQSPSTISISRIDGATLVMDSAELPYLLEQCGYKDPEKDTYKIAVLILTSQNKQMNEFFKEVMELIGTTSITYAKTRYYAVRAQIHKKTKLKITTITQKLLHIISTDNTK